MPAERKRRSCLRWRTTVAACSSVCTPRALSLIERISAPLARCSSTKVDVSLIDVFENAVVMAVRQRRARGASATATDPDEAAAGEMEVLLTGRAGLDKDFCVRFLYRIAIW